MPLHGEHGGALLLSDKPKRKFDMVSKAEIDDVGEEYPDALFKIIKAFRSPLNTDKNDWHDFIEKFSGCCSEHPIERGSQGNYELTSCYVLEING